MPLVYRIPRPHRAGDESRWFHVRPAYLIPSSAGLIIQPRRDSNLRLDGAMSQAARQSVVRKFTKSDSSVILLASLKAGGVGLNLVSPSLSSLTSALALKHPSSFRLPPITST